MEKILWFFWGEGEGSDVECVRVKLNSLNLRLYLNSSPVFVDV